MSRNKLSTKVFLGTFRQIFLWLVDLADCKQGCWRDALVDNISH